jgi:hypothetical protein
MEAEDLPKHELAFRCWATDGEQDDKKTAQLCDIPRRTIAYYRSRDDWRQRWNSAIGPEAGDAARSGQAMARMATPMVMKRLINMVGGMKPDMAPNGDHRHDEDGNPLYVWASADRDASNAAKLLLLYALGPATEQQQPDGPTYAAAFSAAPATTDASSLSDLRSAANAMLEATIQGVNSRTQLDRKGRL